MQERKNREYEKIYLTNGLNEHKVPSEPLQAYSFKRPHRVSRPRQLYALNLVYDIPIWNCPLFLSHESGVLKAAITEHLTFYLEFGTRYNSITEAGC